MIVLDYKDRRPLYEQIVQRFQELILKGILPPDMQMPSVRSQAMQLSINPNTMQRAYSELERQGYIYTVKGKGSFVADTAVLLEEKRAQWMEQFGQKVKEGHSLGISQEEMEQAVQSMLHEMTIEILAQQGPDENRKKEERNLD
ncbi:MAG: GntR family transcriptional regulator [Lachnospiraceae bacterium]|nr:GntR family transcriptional regulator [Lachnospiraceae bacterium]